MNMLSDKSRRQLNIFLRNTADLSLRRKARRIFEELELKPSDRILEIGCGDGYYISILRKLGQSYLVGLDNDIHALNASERNFKMMSINYERLTKWREVRKKGVLLVPGDAQKLPFKNNSFDKIIMSEVAEHLPNDLKGVKEAYRVLKSGGLLILTVPNQYYPFLWDPVNWLLEHFFNTHFKKGFWAGIWNQHLRLYKPEQIETVVKKAGFKIDLIEVQTKWSLPFNHFIANIGARLLAAKALPKSFHKQVNKFDNVEPKKRSLIVSFYYNAAEFFDKFNNKPDKRVGTTVFIKAKK